MASEQDDLQVVLSNARRVDDTTCPVCELEYDRDDDRVPVWIGEPNGDPDATVHKHCSKTSLGYTPSRILLWDVRTPSVKGAIVDAIDDVDLDSDDIMMLLLLFGFMGFAFLMMLLGLA